jgi:hypothetical protein
MITTSCGNPHVTGVIGTDKADGNTPIETDPDDPTPPPPPTDPLPQKITIEIEASVISNHEISKLNLVYKKIVKSNELGEPSESRFCPPGQDHHCIKNRQVAFQFDLTGAKLPDYHYRLKDAEIIADYYSIGKNYRTELLCLLNSRVCSGKGIIRIPKIGFEYLVKMLWWNPSFWARGYSETVPTTLFMDALDQGWNEDAKMYIRENQVFSMKDLFKWSDVNLRELLDNEKIWNFSVTDDTFIDRAQLRLNYEKVR